MLLPGALSLNMWAGKQPAKLMQISVYINFVPYTTGNKHGLDTRVSMKQALAVMGFKGGTWDDKEWNQRVPLHQKAHTIRTCL